MAQGEYNFKSLSQKTITDKKNGYRSKLEVHFLGLDG